MLILSDEDNQIYTKRVRPDIIIHHRGTHNNLMVIEVKKKNTKKYKEARLFDLIKLYALTTQNDLDYKIGVYIELPNEKKIQSFSKVLFEKSKEIEKLFNIQPSKNKVYIIRFN